MRFVLQPHLRPCSTCAASHLIVEIPHTLQPQTLPCSQTQPATSLVVQHTVCYRTPLSPMFTNAASYLSRHSLLPQFLPCPHMQLTTPLLQYTQSAAPVPGMCTYADGFLKFLIPYWISPFCPTVFQDRNRSWLRLTLSSVMDHAPRSTVSPVCQCRWPSHKVSP